MDKMYSNNPYRVEVALLVTNIVANVSGGAAVSVVAVTIGAICIVPMTIGATWTVIGTDAEAGAKSEAAAKACKAASYTAGNPSEACTKTSAETSANGTANTCKK